MNAFIFAITVTLGILMFPVSMRAQSLELRSLTTESVAVLQLDWYADPTPPHWYCHSCLDDQTPCGQSNFSLRVQSTSQRSCRSEIKLPDERARDDFVYRVRVRNEGLKTIRAIEWDYIFIDRVTQTEVARHHFQSEEKVRPGERKTLVEYSNAPPTQVISLTMLSQPQINGYIEKVIIKRVRFKE